MIALAQGDFLQIQQIAVLMVVVHRDDRLGRGHIGRLVGERHVAHTGGAIAVHGHFREIIARQLKAFHLAAVGTDGVIALAQGDFLQIQQIAILMVVVHRDDRFGRGRIIVVEHHAVHIGGAVRIHGDGDHLIAHGHIAIRPAALGLDGMGAGRKVDFLEIQLRAVQMVVHHRHRDLRHRGGCRNIGGFRRGRGNLHVGEGYLSRRGVAGFIHPDIHAVAALKGVSIGVGRSRPDGRRFSGPAFHILGVQQLAVLGDVVHRHLHGIGLEFRRSLRQGHGGHIQQDGHIRLHVVHGVVQHMGVLKAGGHRIHLRLPDEGRGTVAPLIQQVEGISGVAGKGLHGQQLTQSPGVQIDPVRRLRAVRHRHGGNSLRPAVSIRPEDVEAELIPNIRQGGGKACSQEHHNRQGKSQQAAEMRCAIVCHGVSLLRKFT